ncbi:hypothetical protein AB6H32_13225 [Providencia hangzhouensis]
MLTLRFNFAVMVSLLFHFGIVFYCLSIEKTRSAQIYTPIQAAIVSVSLMQNVIEKQVNDTILNNKLSGGLLAESQQNENAVIKVANKKVHIAMKIKFLMIRKKSSNRKRKNKLIKRLLSRKSRNKKVKKMMM